mmetsp:Transcript_40159/g.65984  ORF Transcript_40159/g.65984 Transcript_40159/m.65984 type:complete len:116 (-) Transcript_40159:286-633(-)
MFHTLTFMLRTEPAFGFTLKIVTGKLSAPNMLTDTRGQNINHALFFVQPTEPWPCPFLLATWKVEGGAGHTVAVLTDALSQIHHPFEFMLTTVQPLFLTTEVENSLLLAFSTQAS